MIGSSRLIVRIVEMLERLQEMSKSSALSDETIKVEREWIEEHINYHDKELTREQSAQISFKQAYRIKHGRDPPTS